MKKYRTKRKYYINLVILVTFFLIAVTLIGTGYSLWTTRLNIFGNVTLDLDLPPLEIELLQNGAGKYINFDENVGLSFVRDEYGEDYLITTFRNNSDVAINNNKNLTVNFSMKNTSQTDELYTNGSVTLVECSNKNNAINNVRAYLSKGIIEEGKSDNFNFVAEIDRELLDSNVFYKYEIIYSANGVKKNFFYTINILPAL